MTRPRNTTDGFIPRRPGTPLSRNQDGKSREANSPTRFVSPSERPNPMQTSKVGHSKDLGLTRSDIDESLNSLDEDLPKPAKRRIRFIRRPRSIRKVLKWLVILIIIALVGVGGWLGYKALSSADGIFAGSIFGLAQKNPLKQDANGRSNVLIFGTSEDSDDHNANGGEGGPLLTDSIMVLSVNQEKKDAFMISIPRDLWVRFDEPCSVGYQEKINSVYQCGSNFGENPEAGAAALQKKVGEILGLDIQYYAQVDYSVVTKSVDAVGGIEVTIESNPPGVGILDRNFDWKCNYQCYYVNYKDGETVHLDGEHALALSRARNAQGGYGLAGGNFDREKNQQKILRSLREKALSLGTLTNVGKVTELLDAMGENLKTNVEKSEVQTVVALATEIPSESIISLELNNPDSPLVTNSSVGGASVVIPVAGMFNYTQIQSYITKASSMDAATKEGANIIVLNGSGVPGAAQAEADRLTGEGLTVLQVDNAPEGEYSGIEVYQRTEEGMSATKAKLESIYGVTARADLSILVNGEVDFVVVIGVGGAS